MVAFKLKVKNLPSQTSFFKCNFSTTYFMEIHQGSRDANGKIYESDYWVDEFTHETEELNFSDQELCNSDPNSPIEIKFICRNQY